MLKVNGLYGLLAILLWELAAGREPCVEIGQRLNEYLPCVRHLKAPDLLVLTSTNQLDPGIALYNPEYNLKAKQPLRFTSKWLLMNERETRLELATLSLGS